MQILECCDIIEQTNEKGGATMTELELMQRAKIYMDKLAQGIDPVTDQEVPGDSVLNNVRLARCFFYVSGVLDQVIQNKGRVGQGERKFHAIQEQLNAIQFPEYALRITEFAEFVQKALGDPDMKKPSVTKITGWLADKGFLMKEVLPDGKSRKVPTQQGIALGLTAKLRQSPDGEYLAVYYDTNAQRFLADHLLSICGE